MRIFSNFHDYYDGVTKSYVDDGLIYNRQSNFSCEPVYRKDTARVTKVSKQFQSLIDLLKSTYDMRRVYVDYTRFLIICGQVYPILQVRKNKSKYMYYNRDLGDKSDIFLEATVIEDNKYYLDVNYYLKPFQDTIGLNELYNAPILDISRNRQEYQTIVNGQLSYYNMQKIISGFDMYQRLNYYLGNILIDRDIPEEPTNEQKIQMHGFDKKISFRGT